MKYIFLITTIIIGHSIAAQNTSGINFIKLGGVNLSGDNGFKEDYPVYTDTTGGDSTVYKGDNEVNLQIGYHIGLTKNISVGIGYRGCITEESSYSLSHGYFSARYHFPFGKEKKSENKLFFDFEDREPARNLLFVEASGMYGNMKYNALTEKYIAGTLQAGISIRVPLPKTKFLRNLGFEFSAGGCYRAVPGNTMAFYPIAMGAIQYYFDKKYTIVL